MRASWLLTGSFLVFWISVLGSTGTFQAWRASPRHSLTPRGFEQLHPVVEQNHRNASAQAWPASPRVPHAWMVVGSSKNSSRRRDLRPMSTLLGVRQRQVRVSARKPGVCGAWRGGLESMSRAHWLGGDAADKAEGVRSVYRKRALALRRASGLAARTLVAPEELTAQAILPEEPNGVTSMIAISTVLVFATFAAF